MTTEQEDLMTLPTPFPLYLVIVAAALLLALASPPGLAQDAEGTGDHPLVPRIAGSYIGSMETNEFRSVTLPAGPWDHPEREHTDTLVLEGEWLQLRYRFEEAETSALRVHRSFEQTLPEAGFEMVFAGAGAELLSSGTPGNVRVRNFMIGADYRGDYTSTASLGRRDPVYYLLARHGEEPVYVAVATYILAGRPSRVEYAVTVVTEEEMQVGMDHQPLTAGEMEQGLISEGRVAIQDILFAFDSDDILPESSDSLATIASLLEDRSELGLLVVRHTDDVGDFDYNLRLSMARATAVVDYLVREHGIDRARLNSAGAGMMAPIASNRSEEGRARNRRVELVEIRP